MYQFCGILWQINDGFKELNYLYIRINFRDWWVSKSPHIVHHDFLFRGFYDAGLGKVGVVEHIWTKDYQRSTKNNVISAWGTRSQAKRCCSNILILFVYYPYRIHVWHIYLGLVDFWGKCRWIYHTQILWVISTRTISLSRDSRVALLKQKVISLRSTMKKCAFLSSCVFSVWCHKFTLWDCSQEGIDRHSNTVDGSEIQTTTWDCAKTPIKDGINYQPQLVNAGFLNHQQ